MGLAIPAIALPGRASPVANCYGWISAYNCDFSTPSGAGKMVLSIHYTAADADAWLPPIRQITILPGQQLVPANPSVQATQVAVAGNVATVTTGTPHGFQAGSSAQLGGFTNTQFNGTFTVTAVTAYTFSFALTAANLAATADSGMAVATQAAVVVSSLAQIESNINAYAASNSTTPSVATGAAMYAEFLKHPELVGSTVS